MSQEHGSEEREVVEAAHSPDLAEQEVDTLETVVDGLGEPLHDVADLMAE